MKRSSQYFVQKPDGQVGQSWAPRQTTDEGNIPFADEDDIETGDVVLSLCSK